MRTCSSFKVQLIGEKSTRIRHTATASRVSLSLFLALERARATLNFNASRALQRKSARARHLSSIYYTRLARNYAFTSNYIHRKSIRYDILTTILYRRLANATLPHNTQNTRIHDQRYASPSNLSFTREYYREQQQLIKRWF